VNGQPIDPGYYGQVNSNGQIIKPGEQGEPQAP
jgi:hypothetical protein